MTRGKIYRLSRSGNCLVVNAAVSSNNNQVRKIKLLLDTGSSYTVIRSSLLQSLGYNCQQALNTLKITTAKGVINVPKITVSSFSCLVYQINNFSLVAYDLPAVTYVEGLLGIDFFNRFPLMIYPQKAEVWSNINT